ncbi:MAG: aminoglycoside phosphotransferase, partial [Deltaproteobacteria bacterium]
NFLMHRDFQSRNIMLKEGKFYFIDFQGARFGPPTYDLASFLIDPYVGVPQQLQAELLEGYFDEIKFQIKASREEFINWYWLTALCRNLQILAAFVFLSQVKKKPFFAQFIKPALRQLCHTLDHVDSHKFKRLRFIVTEQARSFLQS